MDAYPILNCTNPHFLKKFLSFSYNTEKLPSKNLSEVRSSGMLVEDISEKTLPCAFPLI